MHEIAIHLRYVPDRDILCPDSLATYLDAMWKIKDISLEETAQTILEDINDHVIPSWLEIRLSKQSEHTEHDVQIEDRQPHWKGRGLLDRLVP
jgi:NADPH-dependent 7-cyano-7-deazaguanine reductase QueF